MNASRVLGAALLSLGALAGAASVAAAQPVVVQLRNEVPEGQKPALTLTAAQKVSDIRLELERGDGHKFEAKSAALARGQTATLPIGDGAPGKAHFSGKLRLRIAATSEEWSYDLAFDAVVRAPLALKYDIEHLDLPGRVLRFQLSRPAGSAELTVLGEDGGEIGHGQATYRGEPAGTWLPIAWSEDKPGRVLMLKLRVTSAEGLRVMTELTPWSVSIEHEDVTFDTDSALIKPSEAHKLDASLARIQEIVKRTERVLKCKLYVAGHTDTVGSSEHNRQLSVERARAIAEYFRRRGLAIPITYEGFGEDVPAVQTPDSTDEPRNRRADYVLGAASASPPFGRAYQAVRAEWKTVR